MTGFASPRNGIPSSRRSATARSSRSVLVTNVMLIDPKTGEPTRAKARIDEDGTKERVSAKSGEPIAKNRGR